jgi:hypothetical protein
MLSKKHKYQEKKGGEMYEVLYIVSDNPEG